MRIVLKEIDTITFDNVQGSLWLVDRDLLFIGEQAREVLSKAEQYLPAPLLTDKSHVARFMINESLSGSDLSRLLNFLDQMCFFSWRDVKNIFLTHIEGREGSNQLRQNGHWNIIPLMTDDGPVPIGIAFSGNKWRISRRLIKDGDVARDGVEEGAVLLLKE